MRFSRFGILERKEDGWVRLVLTGELDLASAPAFEDRLGQLADEEAPVRLDLSRLEFIDSTGLHALIRAMDTAHSRDWRLRIDRNLTPQVARLFELVHVEGLLAGFDSDRP
jgi:anti-anti-sigma factor